MWTIAYPMELLFVKTMLIVLMESMITPVSVKKDLVAKIVRQVKAAYIEFISLRWKIFIPTIKHGWLFGR